MERPYLFSLRLVENKNGVLVIADQPDLPFEVKRVFWITSHDGHVRGAHAHRSSRQVLVAQQGSIRGSLLGVNGDVFKFILQTPDQALYIPPLYWGELHFDTGVIALALASDTYRESDYIRDYAEFKALKNG